MFNFEVLNNMLEVANAGSRAAECHGFICAQVCMSGNISQETVNEYLLGGINNDQLIDECQVKISELVIDIAEQFSSPEFELQLMLPGDEMSLEVRGQALTEWCQGFLSGLGVAGLVNANVLSDAGQELIDDFYKISRLRTNGLDEYAEQGESDLMELVEYVRMGAIFIYDELHGSSGNQKPTVLH